MRVLHLATFIVNAQSDAEVAAAALTSDKMVKIQNETKLQLSSSDDGRQKLKKKSYASYSTLGGATYFNDVRSSIKIIQVPESAGAQAAQSSDGTNIQKKEIVLFTFI